MPKNEMGRSAPARSEPPPLTSGEIEELERLFDERHSSRAAQVDWDDALEELWPRLISSLKLSGGSAAQVPPPIASTAEGSAALDEVRAAAYTMLQFASEPDLAGCTTAFGYFMRRGQAVEFVRGILKKHRALSPKEPTDG